VRSVNSRDYYRTGFEEICGGGRRTWAHGLKPDIYGAVAGAAIQRSEAVTTEQGSQAPPEFIMVIPSKIAVLSWLGRWLQDDLVAKGFQTFDQLPFQSFRVQTIQVVSPQFSIFHRVLQDVIGDDQKGMGDGDDGPFTESSVCGVDADDPRLLIPRNRISELMDSYYLDL
jgi:hypothetical protein